MWDAFVYISNNIDEMTTFQKRFKSRGMFLSSFPDNRRPELRNYQNRIIEFFKRFERQKIIIIPVTKNKPLLYNNKLKKLLENNQADYIIGYIISPIGFVLYHYCFLSARRNIMQECYEQQYCFAYVNSLKNIFIKLLLLNPYVKLL